MFMLEDKNKCWFDYEIRMIAHIPALRKVLTARLMHEMKASSPITSSTPNTALSPSSLDMKVLTILYDGGKAAQEESRLLGTTENKVCAAEEMG